jgi:hypothetical protein
LRSALSRISQALRFRVLGEAKVLLQRDRSIADVLDFIDFVRRVDGAAVSSLQ